MTPDPKREPEAVVERYARRARDATLVERYDPLRPEVLFARQERERALASLLRRHLRQPLRALDLLEVGCGSGDNLLEMLRLGADPVRLVGNELLPERVAAARARLPAATTVHSGDAMAQQFAAGSFDLVLQVTVFSSLLDDDFRHRLAARMWEWLRPGGAVVWYDFVYDNPRNLDVRGVPMAQVRSLFPQARIDARRVTLAPPFGRRVVALHPALWQMFNWLPPLRTHRLAWIEKPL